MVYIYGVYPFSDKTRGLVTLKLHFARIAAEKVKLKVMFISVLFHQSFISVDTTGGKFKIDKPVNIRTYLLSSILKLTTFKTSVHERALMSLLNTVSSIYTPIRG